MLKKKSSGSEKKRKHSQSEDRHDNTKRRSAESNLEQDSKDELADAELDRIGSDIEDGGLDLTLPFKPITAYIGDKKEMLEQCFRVLGDKKLCKMLPDELKEQVLLGLLVNGVGMLGEESAVYLRVRTPEAPGPDPTARRGGRGQGLGPGPGSLQIRGNTQEDAAKYKQKGVASTTRN